MEVKIGRLRFDAGRVKRHGFLVAAEMSQGKGDLRPEGMGKVCGLELGRLFLDGVKEGEDVLPAVLGAQGVDLAEAAPPLVAEPLELG